MNAPPMPLRHRGCFLSVVAGGGFCDVKEKTLHKNKKTEARASEKTLKSIDK